jgi:hypothetical protein
MSRILAVLCLAGACAASEADALFAAWTKDPANHPNIPDVSWAGYQYGEQPLPEPAVVTSVADHGAKAGDGQDDSAAFAAAIAAAAAKGGGAVSVPAGTWELDGMIRLTADGVVLRGEGQGKTVLEFRRPLQDVLGRLPHERLTQWSWGGGLVWMSPANAFDAGGQLAGGKGVEQWERWRQGQRLGSVAAPAPQGASRIQVDAAAAAALKPGMTVLLGWSNPGDLSLLHAMAGHPAMKDYNWGKATGLTSQKEWIWPAEIAAVQGTTVDLRQPLRMPVESRWPVSISLADGLLREAGVERLSIRTKRGGDASHNTYPGWNGIYINRAMHCFVREVAIENTDNGLIHAAAKNTTVSGLAVSGGSHHHATALRVGSHDNLLERFTITSQPMHGINTENLATGNVWRKGVMRAGTFDSHRAMSFDLVRTDIEINNQGRPGGAGSAGPFLGRRCVHWNIRITGGPADFVNQPEQHSMGALVGVQGPSKAGVDFAMPAGDKGTIIADAGRTPAKPDLYEAQLQWRLAQRAPAKPADDKPVAGKPAKPGSAPPAKPSRVDPAVAKRWNTALAERIRAALAAGKRVSTDVAMLGTTADITAVSSSGSLSIASDQGAIQLPVASLDAKARARLAVALAGSDEAGAACAAFHLAAAGDAAGAEAQLIKAGALADGVRSDLGLTVK